MIWMIVWLLTNPPEIQKLRVSPLDFQDQLGKYHFSGVDQIVTDGDKLFVRSVHSPVGAVLDKAGRPLKHFESRSDKDNGKQGILAMAVNPEGLWLTDVDGKTVRKFVNDRHKTSFSLQGFPVQLTLPSSNAFAITPDNGVVLPIRHKNALAVHISAQGQKRLVGEALDFDDSLNTLHNINDTFWFGDGQGYYSLHKYTPMLSRYNLNFELQEQINLSSPVLDRLSQAIYSFEATDPSSKPVPIIWDIQLVDDELWILAGNTLHLVDRRDGQVLAMVQFVGDHKDLGESKGSPLTFFTFAILDNHIFLGHPALFWGHDLWRAPRPKTASM